MTSGFNMFVPFHHAFLAVSSDDSTCLDAHTAHGTLYDTWYYTPHTVRLIIRQAQWHTLPNTTRYTRHTTRHIPYIAHDTTHHTRYDSSYDKRNGSHYPTRHYTRQDTRHTLYLTPYTVHRTPHTIHRTSHTIQQSPHELRWNKQEKTARDVKSKTPW